MAAQRDLAALSAMQARDELLRGAFSAEDYVRACLDRIAEREPAVEAWAFIDSDFALLQARAADAHRKSGRPPGPLHGVPVGLKDIIDTRGMPTENGTAIDAGRRPLQDATLVQKLRESGAIVLGKTVTTELAVFAPGKTRNPHDPKRTPRGLIVRLRCSGSHEHGPARYWDPNQWIGDPPRLVCGVVGFKPTRGLISPRRHRCVPTFSTRSGFSRTIEDARSWWTPWPGTIRRTPGRSCSPGPISSPG
jgi:Asp-tRNA(Asn)/Glu-tRNA(Gln) amidotransferase A subunit family amidase